MLEIWLAFLGGLILGWLIEWIVDWQFWRKSVASLRAENAELRRQLAVAVTAATAGSTATPASDTTPASLPADASLGAGMVNANAPEGK
jgi:hypothetical protein